jgi:hypothetical protein
MDDNPDCSMCFTGYIQLINNKEYIPTSDFNKWLCPVDFNNDPDYQVNSKSLLNFNIVGSSSSRVFRNYNDIFKDYFYNFPYSDWVINFELSYKGKIRYLDYPTYIYRIHNESISKKVEIDERNTNKYEERVNILKNIYESRKTK